MKQRSLYIDIVKLLAIVFVVMCHIPMAFAAEGPTGDGALWRYAMTAIGDMGVPLFMMASGALVLGKDFNTKEDIVRFYKRNWLPIYITGACWCLFYYFLNTDSPSLSGIVKTLLLANKPEVHLWYIRMILAYYLIMPVLSYLREKWVLWAMVALVFVATFGWNGVRIFVQHEAFPTTSGLSLSCYLVYLVLGYKLARSNWHVSNLLLLGITLLSLAAIVMTLSLGWFQFVWYDNPMVLVAAVSLFLLVKQTVQARTATTLVTCLSNMTFGVYLCHVVLLQPLGKAFGSLYRACDWAAFAMVGVLALLVSFAAVSLLCRVLPPPIAKVLFRCTKG